MDATNVGDISKINIFHRFFSRKEHLGLQIRSTGDDTQKHTHRCAAQGKHSLVEPRKPGSSKRGRQDPAQMFKNESRKMYTPRVLFLSFYRLRVSINKLRVSCKAQLSLAGPPERGERNGSFRVNRVIARRYKRGPRGHACFTGTKGWKNSAKSSAKKELYERKAKSRNNF